MDLRSTTERLLDDNDIASKLRVADMYIRQYNENPGAFVLPRKYIELKPVIEAFALDLDKFTKYIKACRDSVAPRSKSYRELHELYRTMNVRTVQQQRRERLGMALSLYEAAHPRVEYDAKMKWLRKVEQKWGRERMQILKQARDKTKGGRLSLAEAESILTEFWAGIVADLKKGKLPE